MKERGEEGNGALKLHHLVRMEKKNTYRWIRNGRKREAEN